ncbi:MAG TPA: acyltransferase [Candidatus Acidoferrum sp.]|nr:acyltransferase [Candidatus Acidoferrum sp.]
MAVKVALPRALEGASVAPAPVRESPRVGELDGIRAIAIWLVLIIHITMRGDTARAGAALQGVGRIAFVAVDHMWLGVDLFFVLSGFLITGILLDTKHRPAYFRNFYIRRFLRIVPLVVLVIGLMTLIAPGYGAWYALGLFFLSDVAPMLSVGNPPGAPPLWSLAVEEQFYLVWPVLVLALTSRRLVVLAIAIVALEPLIRFATFGTLLEVPWCRSDGLAIGALAAIFVRQPVFGTAAARRLLATIAAAVIGLVLIEVIARNATLSGALRLTEADLVFGAAIVAAVAWSGSRWIAALRSRPMRFFADTSFCVYLIHVPIIEQAGRLEGGISHAPFLAAVLRALFVLPITFALAALSYRYFESPLLRLKAVFAR